MKIDLDHPFQPGARVAVRQGNYGADYTYYKEAFVEKVYKTGHFALKGLKQRFRPFSYKDLGLGQIRWVADRTEDDSWNLTCLLLWDEATDKEILKAQAEANLRNRLRSIQDRIGKLKYGEITTEFLGVVEEAIKSITKEE